MTAALALRLHRVLAAMVLVTASSCTDTGAEGPSPSHGGAAAADAGHAGLTNVRRVTDGVYSGSMPHGDAGFDSLEELGVRTIVSVDGARPDLERARTRGLRYVHIPVPYRGIDREAQAALGRSIRDLPGPIYVHCHHGKHRGPAAAAIGLVAIGVISAEEGVAVMRAAGTSPDYPGLYESVATAMPLDDATISSSGLPLPEYAEVSGLTATMAAIDQIWDHLRLLRDHGWRAPEDHPDLVATAEAGMLADCFRGLTDDDEAANRPDDFRNQLRTAQAEASELEQALLDGEADRAGRIMTRIARSCTTCHTSYRNAVTDR